MPRPPKPTITKLGAEMRGRRGPNQDGAAQACGIQRETFSRIERGAHRPSYDTALKLARWLGWTVEQVMEAAGEPVELQAGQATPGEE